MSRARTRALTSLGLGTRWRGDDVATVAGAVLTCRHRVPPLPGMCVRDLRSGRSRDVYGPIPRLIAELRRTGESEPSSDAFSVILAWALAVRTWEGDAGMAPVVLQEQRGLLIDVPQGPGSNILLHEPGALIRSLLVRQEALPGAGDRAAVEAYLTRAALPALVFEDRGHLLRIRWPVLVGRTRPTRGPARPDALSKAEGKAQILQLIDGARRPLPVSTLLGKVSAPAPTVRRWVAELVEEGALEPTAANPRNPRQSYRRPTTD